MHCILFRLTLLSIFLVTSGLITIQASQIKPINIPSNRLNITATLEAKPTTFKGLCPTTISFKGEICVNQAATVKYQFIRYGIKTSTVHQLEFKGKGTRRVHTTLKIKKDTRSYMYIKIISPVKKESNKAYFNVHCDMQTELINNSGISPHKPFDIKVEQRFPSYYLGDISLKATLVPRYPGVENNQEIMKRTVHFFIGGKYVGKAAKYKVILFYLKPDQAAKFNFKPGTYELRATAMYKGQAISGTTNFLVHKTHAKIKEMSSPALFHHHGGKNYGTCHNIGDKLIVVAKFTHKYNDEPIKNYLVYFRHHAKEISEAITNEKGVAVFTFILDPRLVFDKIKPPATYSKLYVQQKLNFYFPGNDCYGAVTDWGNPERVLYACPTGLTFNPSNGYCENP